METESEKCEECNDRGWHHMGEPFEIQRCAYCPHLAATDTEAGILHKKTCGCDWPSDDWQNAIARSLVYGHKMVRDRELHVILDQFVGLARDREDFIANLPGLTRTLGRGFIRANALPHVHPDVLGSMKFVASALTIVSHLADSVLGKPVWLLDFEDGTYDKIKDKWFAPETNSSTWTGIRWSSIV